MKNKNKRWAIVAVTFALAGIIFTTCKKDVSRPSSISENQKGSLERQYEGLKHVKQSNYFLDEAACSKVIKRFKETVKSSNSGTERLIEADSVALDSAVWVVEATLNYDLDYDVQDNYEYTYVSTQVECSINEDNLNIDSDDLEAVYEDLYDYAANLVSDTTKIEFIDVEGYLHDPGTSQAIFKVTIAVLGPVFNGCSSTPFGSNPNTRWCVYYIADWFNAFGCSYPGSATTDATDRLTNALNCKPQFSVCEHGQYYTNINPLIYDANASNSTFNGALHLGGWYANSWYCQSGNANTFEINYTQGNNYYANCLTLAASNPIFGLNQYNTQVKSFRNWSSPLVSWRITWTLTSYWGKRLCRTIPD